MYIILLGAPGAGKGTQAKILAQSLGLVHVASGDLFREAVGQGTELGKQAKSYMERGLLVPDDIVIGMVLERLGKPDAAGGVLLDGFPRTLEQAKALDGALTTQGQRIDSVALIAVDSEELVRRLSSRRICRSCQTPFTEAEATTLENRCRHCGGELYQRADDQPEVVRKRLDVYTAQTAPLIEYYQRLGKLVEVNGEQDVASVSRDMLQALGVKG